MRVVLLRPSRDSRKLPPPLPPPLPPLLPPLLPLPLPLLLPLQYSKLTKYFDPEQIWCWCVMYMAHRDPP